MPRFVLLRHECPVDYREGPHWDLMFEREEEDVEYRLATWSLTELPSAWRELLGFETCEAISEVFTTALGDHRIAYLDYEGPLTGDRGEVKRLAEGKIAWHVDEPNRVEIEILSPSRLAGHVELTCDEPGKARWRLSCSPTD